MPGQLQSSRDLQLQQCVRFKSSSVPETILPLLYSIATGIISCLRLQLMPCKTLFLETGAWEKAVQSHSWVALHMISLGPTRLISFSSEPVVTHYLFQKHLDVSALYTTEVCLLERLVNPREVTHECMEPVWVQHYAWADEPTLNVEGFEAQGRLRVSLQKLAQSQCWTQPGQMRLVMSSVQRHVDVSACP